LEQKEKVDLRWRESCKFFNAGENRNDTRGDFERTKRKDTAGEKKRLME